MWNCHEGGATQVGKLEQVRCNRIAQCLMKMRGGTFSSHEANTNMAQVIPPILIMLQRKRAHDLFYFLKEKPISKSGCCNPVAAVEDLKLLNLNLVI